MAIHSQVVPDDFTLWHGGDNPLPGQWCEVQYGDGMISVPTLSNWFTEATNGDLWQNKVERRHFHIIAYRVVPAPTVSTDN